ncbi:MAG TPA: response regulator [Polyangiaceae bacterium]|nr:response regulator [Polyangiaceae bacterium]
MSELNSSENSVLLVDDDLEFRSTLARAFRRRGWEVFEADSPAGALELARNESPEHAVVDLRMPEGDGIALVRALRALDPALRIVLLTGFGSIATAVECMRAGAINYLTKPADVADILLAFEGQQQNPEIVVPSLDRVEWEHIQRVLHSCGGNVTQAAQLLGLHRRSLQRKLRRNPRAR